MKDPISNSQGYANSSVHITDGFRNSHFLLAQGSAGENSTSDLCSTHASSLRSLLLDQSSPHSSTHRFLSSLLSPRTPDDNVHFSNSAHLLDLLTAEKIRDFRFRMFTDSDHSISMRGAYRELHEFMNRALADWWGPGGKRQ